MTITAQFHSVHAALLFSDAVLVCPWPYRYLVPERLWPWRREGPLEPLLDVLYRHRHTWKTINERRTA
jgi:hypothetical protein